MVEIYNTELARLTEQGKGTWFTAPWLYAECASRLDATGVQF